MMKSKNTGVVAQARLSKSNANIIHTVHKFIKPFHLAIQLLLLQLQQSSQLDRDQRSKTSKKWKNSESRRLGMRKQAVNVKQKKLRRLWRFIGFKDRYRFINRCKLKRLDRTVKREKHARHRRLGVLVKQDKRRMLEMLA
jgi:hypothetical protein